MGLDLFISKKNKPRRCMIMHELKVIIFNKHDFVLRKNKQSVILFLQPEWSKQEEMTPFIVDYVMSNPKWST
jgi:hypothetical protein